MSGAVVAVRVTNRNTQQKDGIAVHRPERSGRAGTECIEGDVAAIAQTGHVQSSA